MYIKIALIVLLFINCSKPVEIIETSEPVYTYELSKELQPYVFDYINTLDKFGIKFKKQSFIVVFDADIMGTPLVGEAKGMFNNDLVYVKINPKLWNQLTVKQKRHLIFHELSHDVFNIEHTEDIELMKPSMPSPAESFKMNIEQEIINLMMYIRNEQS
tara:strand:- start:6 stop:482 length:477 start_codon:yes stop_codon:yes gene_type:complete